jgi:exonuclease III
MKKYDWYAEMSDDSRKWDAQQAMNSQLKMLAKKIGAERAVEIWNNYAPKDRKIDASFFMMREDKISKIKEALKKALKKSLKEGDPALKPVDDNIAKKETELANLYTQKANILKKPGSQT